MKPKGKQLDTPGRAAIRGAKRVIDYYDIQLSKRRIFAALDIDQKTGERALDNRLSERDLRRIDNAVLEKCSDWDARRPQNDERLELEWGKNTIFSEADGDKVFRYYQTNDQQRDARRQNYRHAANEALKRDPDYSTATLRRSLRKRGIRPHLKQTKANLSRSTKQDRVARARHELKLGLWDDPSWRRKVISFNELHFRFTSEGRNYVFRTAKEAYEW